MKIFDKGQNYYLVIMYQKWFIENIESYVFLFLISKYLESLILIDFKFKFEEMVLLVGKSFCIVIGVRLVMYCEIEQYYMDFRDRNREYSRQILVVFDIYNLEIVRILLYYKKVLKSVYKYYDI